jgi:hypothetical protein
MDPPAFRQLILQQIAFRHKSAHIVREERTRVATRAVSAKSRCAELPVMKIEELMEIIVRCDRNFQLFRVLES